MKILVTGRNGQVGWELQRALAPLGEVVTPDRSVFDLAEPLTLGPAIEALRPDVIVNAAAYTAVDLAESEAALASRVNAESVGVIASAAKRTGSLLIHYSTDYVFDGQATRPYVETDAVAPLNAYGSTKLDGERMIEAAGGDWLTFRTSWVYSTRGKNFLRTMLRLAGERDELRVVSDQQGAPTSARMIADLTAHVISRAQDDRSRGSFESGLFHMTASGATTWHGFASEIVSLAQQSGKLPVKATTVSPVPTQAYPTPARRPGYSLLDNTKFDTRFSLNRLDWRAALRLVFNDIVAG